MPKINSLRLRRSLSAVLAVTSLLIVLALSQGSNVPIAAQGNATTSTTLTPPTPNVDVLLYFYSPNGFPTINASYFLHIGEKQFYRGTYPSGSRLEYFFILDQEEFDMLRDGDDVFITHGGILPIWYFGAFDRSKLRMQESLRLKMQRTLAATLLRDSVDAQDVATIDTVREYIYEAANFKHWLDDLHLQPVSGVIVFDGSIAARQAIETIHINSNESSRQVGIIMSNLGDVARGIARLAIDEAAAAGVPQSVIQRAETAFANGEAARMGVAAISAYREAWRLIAEVITAAYTATPTIVVPEYVRLQFFIPTGFPVVNAATVLHIGTKQFIGGINVGVDCSSSMRCYFLLTPDQFASVNDGAEMIITGGGTFYFGRLDKRDLDMEEQLRATKERAVAILISIREMAATAEDVASIDVAIAAINESIKADYWIDQLRLQPNYGLLTFDADIKAINSLQSLTIRTNQVGHDVYDVRKALIHADSSIVKLIIDEAKQAGVSSNITDQAFTLYANGYTASLSGEYAAAISDYREAWKLIIDSTGGVIHTVVPTLKATPA